MTQTGALPLEIWDQIFSYCDRQDCLSCLTVNKDWHILITDLMLSRYASYGPSRQEIITYLSEHRSGKSSLILLDSQGSWVEIERLGKDRYLVYEKSGDKSLQAITIPRCDINTRLHNDWLLDPLSYRAVMEKRKSAIKLFPAYVDDMLLLHVNELLQKFATLGSLKWRLLYMVIDSMH